MFILLMEFKFSIEGIWKQITHEYAAASMAGGTAASSTDSSCCKY